MKTCEAKRFSLAEATLEAAPFESSSRDFRLKVRLPFYRDWTPGQFVMLRWGRHLIARPFAIVDWRRSAEGGSVMSLWIRRLGGGTEELFRDGVPGMSCWVTAPLGNGFESSVLAARRLILVSGGVGGASVLPLAEARLQAGKTEDLWIHGERDPSTLDHELMRLECAPKGLCFERDADKSAHSGRAGRVTDALVALTAREAVADAIVACGPTPMLEAVARTAAAHAELGQVPLWLGLEERMGCGIGICFSCSVWSKVGMKRLCTEGPWFKATDIPDHFKMRGAE